MARYDLISDMNKMADIVKTKLTVKTPHVTLLKIKKIDGKKPSSAKKNIGTLANANYLLLTPRQLILLTDFFPERWGKMYVRNNNIQFPDVVNLDKATIIFKRRGEEHSIEFERDVLIITNWSDSVEFSTVDEIEF